MERDVVVELGLAGARGGTSAAPPSARRRAGHLVLGTASDGFTAAARATVEHGERAAEARDHDLGGVALLAVLVGPFARRKLALDIDLGTLAHVFLRDLGQLLVEDHDPVPFGALLALAGLAIPPRIRRGHRHVHHGSAILHGLHFGVAPQIADQDDFVDAARHGGLLRFPGAAGRRTYLTAGKLAPTACGQPPILGCVVRTAWAGLMPALRQIIGAASKPPPILMRHEPILPCFRALARLTPRPPRPPRPA